MQNYIPSIKRERKRYNKTLIYYANKYLKTVRKLKDLKELYPVRMYSSLNLFLWHLEGFKQKKPGIKMVKEFQKHIQLLENIAELSNFKSKVPVKNKNYLTNFEKSVYTLFSDIWIDMTDDIYFDQTFKFTCERFKKNKINPNKFFKNKIVLDAGCGSGKFSATIAKLGAKKVYGLDLGEKGLNFAKKQALKKKYCSKIKYIKGSLLNIPFKNNYFDVIFSNGVVHHTANYNKCISEFSRVLKTKGNLYLYVNGLFGLFELLQDTLRVCNQDIPRNYFQEYIKNLNVDSGRLYWLMDCLYAPYEYKSYKKIENILYKNNFRNINQLIRGVKTDQIEQITKKIVPPETYGQAQIKIICEKI